MQGNNHILKARKILPLRGESRSTAFHLPSQNAVDGFPPFSDRLVFGLDARNVHRISNGYSFPRCLGTGKLPTFSNVPLTTSASDRQNGYPLLNFSGSNSLRYSNIRLRTGNTTQFVLTKPSSVTGNYYLAEMGQDLNSYPGIYFYQGGTAVLAFRNETVSPLTQAWTTASDSVILLRGHSTDKGNFGCAVGHMDVVNRTMWLRRNLVDIPITINYTGAPSYGWPNSPTGGVVNDIWVGSRTHSTLFYTGLLAGHYIYNNLSRNEALEVEAWLNERWAFMPTPKMLFRMVADDATGTNGSAITGIADRITGIVGATTGTMPKLKTNALNGHATLEYDADYSLKFPGLTLPGSHTYVLVSKRTSSAHEFVEHGADTNTNDGSFIYAAGNGMMAIRRTGLFNATDTSFSGSSGTWYTRLTSCTGGNTGVMGRRNDSFISSGTLTTFSPSLTNATADLWVGSRNGAALQMRGEIAELRIYDGALNYYQSANVMEELRSTYGHY